MTDEEKKIELGKPTHYGMDVWKACGVISCRLCMQGVKCDCSLFPCTSYTRRMLEISNKLEG